MFLDDLQTLMRMGSRAAELRDTVVHKSVAAAARDSIFQFPCLVSNTVPVNMATATARLLDRNYASFVQIVLSQVANVDISIDRTPVQFLKRVHQNMRLESVEDEKWFNERFFDGNMIVAMNAEHNVAVAFESATGANASKLRSLNIESCREFLSDFDLVPFFEADGDEITVSDIVGALTKNRMNQISRDKQELNQKIGNGGKAPSLMDHDVKKLNDLQPYAIQVRLNVINENNEFVEYWDIVVGVKTILHLIKSDEIIDNIARSIQGRGTVFNFIRWTTGEISLIKDIMLHINDIKFDMRNRAKGYSAWFPTLKRMKDRKVNFRDFRVNQLIPNATLVISSYEVDTLESKYGIYLKDAAVASKLINNLFLMCLIILDEGSQTMDILYNDSTAFETYALETVQREVALNSNRLANEIGRMIGSQR